MQRSIARLISSLVSHKFSVIFFPLPSIQFDSILHTFFFSSLSFTVFLSFSNRSNLYGFLINLFQSLMLLFPLPSSQFPFSFTHSFISLFLFNPNLPFFFSSFPVVLIFSLLFVQFDLFFHTFFNLPSLYPLPCFPSLSNRSLLFLFPLSVRFFYIQFLTLAYPLNPFFTFIFFISFPYRFTLCCFLPFSNRSLPSIEFDLHFPTFSPLPFSTLLYSFLILVLSCSFISSNFIFHSHLLPNTIHRHSNFYIYCIRGR